MDMLEISKMPGDTEIRTEKKRKKRISQVDKKLCVACGCCVKVCPVEAISIYRGVYAQVDAAACAGCRKCVAECPASVIDMTEVDR